VRAGVQRRHKGAAAGQVGATAAQVCLGVVAEAAAVAEGAGAAREVVADARVVRGALLALLRGRQLFRGRGRRDRVVQASQAKSIAGALLQGALYKLLGSWKA